MIGLIISTMMRIPGQQPIEAKVRVHGVNMNMIIDKRAIFLIWTLCIGRCPKNLSPETENKNLRF